VTFAHEVTIEGTAKAAKNFESKNYQNDVIDHSLDVASLGEGFTAVHHDGSLLASVDNDTYHPICIFKLAATK